ncbi:MAG: hypothetical protein M3Y64_11410 [Gemmatimonadota bacterium]|nr:hypothetical protein [Gemmatimonadota bacterium]
MNAPFVTSLGVRDETIQIVGAGSDAWPETITIKVHCAEVWDAVRVAASLSTTVRAVKQAALAVLMPDIDMLDTMVVKMHGAEISNEAVSLKDAGAKNGTTLLIMSRRRRAVR